MGLETETLVYFSLLIMIKKLLLFLGIEKKAKCFCGHPLRYVTKHAYMQNAFIYKCDKCEIYIVDE